MAKKMSLKSRTKLARDIIDAWNVLSMPPRVNARILRLVSFILNNCDFGMSVVIGNRDDAKFVRFVQDLQISSSVWKFIYLCEASPLDPLDKTRAALVRAGLLRPKISRR